MKRLMHSKSDNKQIMFSYVTWNYTKLFNLRKNRYQNSLQSMRGSESVFDYVYLLHCKWHKIKLNRSGSYIDFPDWIKNENVATNQINKKHKKCFQYAITVALIYKEIENDSQTITKIILFMNKYNWEGTNYSSEKNDWKNFRKIVKQLLLALTVL